MNINNLKRVTEISEELKVIYNIVKNPYSIESERGEYPRSLIFSTDNILKDRVLKIIKDRQKELEEELKNL